MSNIYVDLKCRIPEVAREWTLISRAQLQAAQNAAGLSDEAVARQFPVATKTYWRWKKRQAVPTRWLPRLSEILGVELIPEDASKNDGHPEGLEATVAQISVKLAKVLDKQLELQTSVAALQRTLDEQATRPQVPRARRQG